LARAARHLARVLRLCGSPSPSVQTHRPPGDEHAHDQHPSLHWSANWTGVSMPRAEWGRWVLYSIRQPPRGLGLRPTLNLTRALQRTSHRAHLHASPQSCLRRGSRSTAGNHHSRRGGLHQRWASVSTSLSRRSPPTFSPTADCSPSSSDGYEVPSVWAHRSQYATDWLRVVTLGRRFEVGWW
jgi:hypothetical protein